MSDSCDVNFSDACDDADPAEFCTSRIVKAKQSHTCSECGGQIHAGETYRLVVYKFEGEFGSDKVCDPCRETAGAFEYSLVGGCLWEMLEEEWDRGAHILACITRLESAKAKDHMRHQWITWRDKRMRGRSNV